MMLRRLFLLTAFALALVWAQLNQAPSGQEAGARLNLSIDPLMPARVYLFKDDRPFRFSPVQAILPLRVDLFYRERLWTSGSAAETLEVTCNDESHFLLLRGRASFELPAGRYRVEAYRGTFFTPAEESFELRAGETRDVILKLRSWANGAERDWISSDDHIHLTRTRADDEVYLRWLEAEDLTVANFLQLQRQMDAAAQYGFGAAGQATLGGYTIRPGHESRAEFFGHINLLGGNRMIRPLSVGAMYANSPESYPFPAVLFGQGRGVGATVGYAHFNGSMPHSTLPMDLALGNIDFIEVFQFGVLKTQEWYELLNAGLRVTGIAGSDFPVPLNRRKAWPRWISLLGPERTMVKRRGVGEPYAQWAAGVRAGDVVVTNGPILELQVDEAGGTANATASFYRPIERLEIVRNGAVIAQVPGDGKALRLGASVRLPREESAWVAARVTAQKRPDEPDIQAHTNPVYVLRDKKSVRAAGAREKLAGRWEAEVEWYRHAPLVFPQEAQRQEFFGLADKALVELRKR